MKKQDLEIIALLWVRLWQITCGRLIFGKEMDWLWCVRMIARACSVRHCIFWCKRFIFWRNVADFVASGRWNTWFFRLLKVDIRIAWKLIYGPSWMSKIRKSFQFHGRWGVSKQKIVGAKQDLIVAHLIEYGVIVVWPSAWSTRTHRGIAQFVFHACNFIFADYQAICQSRTHTAGIFCESWWFR